jgi:hypothetical protein
VLIEGEAYTPNQKSGVSELRHTKKKNVQQLPLGSKTIHSKNFGGRVKA